MLIIVWKK